MSPELEKYCHAISARITQNFSKYKKICTFHNKPTKIKLLATTPHTDNQNAIRIRSWVSTHRKFCSQNGLRGKTKHSDSTMDYDTSVIRKSDS